MAPPIREKIVWTVCVLQCKLEDRLSELTRRRQSELARRRQSLNELSTDP